MCCFIENSCFFVVALADTLWFDIILVEISTKLMLLNLCLCSMSLGISRWKKIDMFLSSQKLLHCCFTKKSHSVCWFQQQQCVFASFLLNSPPILCLLSIGLSDQAFVSMQANKCNALLSLHFFNMLLHWKKNMFCVTALAVTACCSQPQVDVCFHLVSLHIFCINTNNERWCIALPQNCLAMHFHWKPMFYVVIWAVTVCFRCHLDRSQHQGDVCFHLKQLASCLIPNEKCSVTCCFALANF